MGYLVFQSRFVQERVIEQISKVLTEKSGTTITISRVRISLFKKIVVEDLCCYDQSVDTLLYSRKIIAGIDSLSVKRKKIHFNHIDFLDSKINIKKKKSDSYNFSFLITPDKPQKTGEWNFFCYNFRYRNGGLCYEELIEDQLNNTWFKLHDMNFSVDSVLVRSNVMFSFRLKSLGFISHDGFILKNLSVDAACNDQQYLFRDLHASTQFSLLYIDSLRFDARPLLGNQSWKQCPLDVSIQELNFNFQDIAFIFPDYASEGLSVSLQGAMRGTFSELSGKGINAQIGDVTSFSTDFYINGLPDFKNTYMFLNLYKSYANIEKIRELDLPHKLRFIKDKMPGFFKNIGVFRYEGNFTGFLNDFVAYGNAYSNLGSITCDISFKPSERGILSIRGNLKSNQLNIGKIFEIKQVGKLTLSGKVQGQIVANQYNIDFKGLIDKAEVNGYPFRQAVLNGNLQNKLFNGFLSIDDPNLKMTYSGKLDLSEKIPYFEFVSMVDQANLKELNINNDPLSKIAFGIDANFTGNNIDNLRGELIFKNVSYTNVNDSLFLARAIIKNIQSGDSSHFKITSDWIDGEVIGNYNFLNISSSLVAFFQNFLPSLYDYGKTNSEENNRFFFSFDIKKTEQFTNVFIPDWSFTPPFTIEGYYKPMENTVLIETTIPIVRYRNQELEKIRLRLSSDEESIHCRVKTNTIHFNKNFKIQNFTIDATGKNDQLATNISWNNYGADTYSGMIKSVTTFHPSEKRYPEVSVSIEPSQLYIADSLWLVDQSYIIVDSSSVRFKNLSFKNNDQSILLYGLICDEEDSVLTAKINNVDLRLFESVFGENNLLGKINGEIRLLDAYRKLILNMGINVNQFSFDDNYLGNLSVNSMWDSEKERLNTSLSLIDKGSTILEGKGSIDPIHNQIDFNLNLENTPFALLKIVNNHLFYNLQGHVSGPIHLHGKTSNLMADGILTPAPEVGIGFRAIKTTYYLSDPVTFRNDSILFTATRFKDDFNNWGLLYGSIHHNNFSDPIFDLKVQSDNVMAMNTTHYDHEMFYGSVFANGVLSIRGRGNQIVLDGDIRSDKGTAIYIPFNRTEKASEFDFIKFSGNKPEERTTGYIPQITGVSMNFDIEVTPDAKVQLIFNSKTGDIIRGEGNGNLQVKIDHSFNIEMYGDYIISEGDYLFTLQNVINKRFSILPGSSIKWMGHPYEASLDIVAVYKVKTSLYDLFPDSHQNDEFKRRIPVDCKIILKDKLQQPVIDFQIELPTAEERIKDQVNQMMATPEDVNKQFISLLMLGRFYTPEFFNGKPTADAGVELMGATASELISNQLSNWLSQISDEWNIGINIRPGNEVSNDQVELALSTQILNDRVTIDGNIANNANPTVNRSGDFVGDFDVNIKLTDNGKLQFKAYTHSNDNLIYDTAPTTQGIGFLYREEFNTLKELFQYYKENIFRKKKKVDKIEKGNSEN